MTTLDEVNREHLKRAIKKCQDKEIKKLLKKALKGETR